MNLIKELLVLTEEALKLPSFGDMQKAIYNVVIPHVIKEQPKGSTLSAGDLHREAENDRFWVHAFDEAYATLKKFVEGHKDIDEVLEEMALAADEVVDSIHDYYSNNWNFEPGTKLPAFKHPGQTLIDDIEQAFFKLVPGAKEKAEADREHRGTVNAMHQDFVKIANRQRDTK